MKSLVSYSVDLRGWPRAFHDIVFDQPITADQIEAVRHALLKAARINHADKEIAASALIGGATRICVEDITILNIIELKEAA